MSTTRPRLTPHQQEALDGLPRAGGTTWHVERGVVYSHLVRKGYADLLIEKGPRGGEIRSYRKGTGAAFTERSGQLTADSAVPSAVQAYHSFQGVARQVRIDSVFHPDHGWHDAGQHEVISIGSVRRHQAAGVTVLALAVGSVLADFTVAELLR